jgi:acyl-CoA thioesterase-1
LAFPSRIVRNLLLWLGLVAGAITPLQAGTGVPAILVLGDSLSAGYGLAAGESWVDLLQQRLASEGHPHRVVNASISGDTTRGGLARLPRALTVHQPSILIIELGGNDGLRGIPVGEYRNNLERMIELGASAGARVLVAGIRLPPNYGPAYSQKFQDAQADAAAGTAFVPFILDGVALEPGMMQADGIHPTAAAQPRMLDNVWPALVPLVEATGGGAAGR